MGIRGGISEPQKIIKLLDDKRLTFKNSWGGNRGTSPPQASEFPMIPCAVKINGRWRKFIFWIFMGDIKIIFGVKVTYIDVHWPPTSWVWRTKCHRDRGSWWKFRGSPKRVIWAVWPNSRYLKIENRDFLNDNDFYDKTDDGWHSLGNFQFFV